LWQSRSDAAQQNPGLFDHLVGERERPVWNMARFYFPIKSD